ncbi:hypothetical protein FB45DRAFT_871515 [Roridomyces roridus]|uniref:Uncharacterized protein n=1 Tax=Roridomyces roridus TaxID=1738132 RepID=A0AAD7BFK5_9AGAR|nr:hypothetical protein FB45DRAFT_871515 [Roridomyces roridus]
MHEENNSSHPLRPNPQTTSRPLPTLPELINRNWQPARITPCRTVPNAHGNMPQRRVPNNTPEHSRLNIAGPETWPLLEIDGKIREKKSPAHKTELPQTSVGLSLDSRHELPNLEPERAFTFSSAFERVRTPDFPGDNLSKLHGTMSFKYSQRQPTSLWPSQSPENGGFRFDFAFAFERAHSRPNAEPNFAFRFSNFMNPNAERAFGSGSNRFFEPDPPITRQTYPWTELGRSMLHPQTIQGKSSFFQAVALRQGYTAVRRKRAESEWRRVGVKTERDWKELKLMDKVKNKLSHQALATLGYPSPKPEKSRIPGHDSSGLMGYMRPYQLIITPAEACQGIYASGKIHLTMESDVDNIDRVELLTSP